MDKEIINILVGAAISIITFSISSYIQWRRDERSRQWAMEDRKLERRHATLNARLSESRKFLEDAFMTCQEFFKIEHQLIHGGIPKDLNVQRDELKVLFKATSREMPSILSLEHDEIRKSVIELTNLLSDEEGIFQNLVQIISSKKIINKEEEIKRINEFIAKTMTLHNFILKRLDELSGFD